MATELPERTDLAKLAASLDDTTLEAIWAATLAMDQDVHADPCKAVWDRLAQVHASLDREMNRRRGYAGDGTRDLSQGRLLQGVIE